MYTTLIECSSLLKNLSRPDYLVIDCRFNLSDPLWGQKAYQQGHIPTAHYFHLDHDLSSPITPLSGRHPLPDPIKLAKRLTDVGLSAKHQVVVYDESNGMMASRAWWLLHWMGHEAVAVLNGGLAAWQSIDAPITTDLPTPQAAPLWTPSLVPSVISTEQLWLTAHPAWQLIDARAAERFRGEVEPIDPIAGHIPKALNRPLTDNLQADGRFKTPEQLKAGWLTLLNGKLPENIVHMCGSGVSACHNILAMEVAGLTGSKLYAGSWSEWIRDPQRPVATGSY
ncbi:sulfurtransferase [Thiolinea disciformis]|uniref:sulfurtransferase n=1 Tax=Thiolinea disciformis TaxID=125614 RepID=UPI0003688BAF|nr:sulfurtransferase [Thiolinea disciformis]